jgi:hypothetical protein
VSGSDGEWVGVLIYEIGAKLRSTSAEPKPIDPDELGERLRSAIEEAVHQFDSQGEVQVEQVRYAGSRGSTRFRAGG